MVKIYCYTSSSDFSDSVILGVGSENFAFLTSSQVMLILLVLGSYLKATENVELNQAQDLELAVSEGVSHAELGGEVGSSRCWWGVAGRRRRQW